MIGLDDIHQVVRLMSLCASGHISVDGDGSRSTETCQGALNALLAFPEGVASDCLVYLTTAIGAIVQDNVHAAKLLTQLCTQVIAYKYQW